MAIDVMIITERDKHYEYKVEDVSDALDRYINEELYQKNRFSTTKEFWDALKDKIDITDYRVNLLNGFCKRDRYKVKRVLTDYKQQYPLYAKFVGEGVSLYINEVKQPSEFTIQANGIIEGRVSSDMGYRIDYVSVSNTSFGSANFTYDPVTQWLIVKDLTQSVIITVHTTKITDGYWPITVEFGDGMIVSETHPTVEHDGNHILFSAAQNGASYYTVSPVRADITRRSMCATMYRNGIKCENISNADCYLPDPYDGDLIIYNINSPIYVKLEAPVY